MAAAVLCQFATHKPVLDAKVRIDYLFAFGPTDANGNKIGPAIKCHGHQALAEVRKLGLKCRVAGRGDAEIVIDGDWWHNADEEEQRSLLDHELHHIAVVEKQTDDIGRPRLKLRHHDVEFGWFSIVASRHGTHSMERIQAASMMETHGQYFWPELVR